jgi:hypothetical protein
MDSLLSTAKISILPGDFNVPGSYWTGRTSAQVDNRIVGCCGQGLNGAAGEIPKHLKDIMGLDFDKNTGKRVGSNGVWELEKSPCSGHDESDSG